MAGLGDIPDLGPPSVRSDYEGDSSASSGQKRRRDGSPKQATTFLQATRNLVERRCNTDICWLCEAPGTEFCHVVARADPAYKGMVRKGMLTFENLGDYRNAIVLCASCHKHFDRSTHTGWVFLPTLLEFFINWETEDFAKREEAFRQSGRRIARKFPNEEDYEHHCRSRNLISDPNDGLYRGGLYNGYILEEMFSPVESKALQEQGLKIPGLHPQSPKRWHGAPMAAINRGFVVMGAPYMKLPEREWDALQRLQRLYTRELNDEETGRDSRADRNATIQVEQGSGPDNVLSHQQGTSVSTTATSTTAAGARNVDADTNHSTTRSPADNDIDSAVDLQSRQGHKRRRGDWSESRTDRGTCPSSDAESHPSRKRRRSKVKELGKYPDSWCFGPMSSSGDKLVKFTGKSSCYLS